MWSYSASRRASHEVTNSVMRAAKYASSSRSRPGMIPNSPISDWVRSVNGLTEYSFS